MIGNICFLRELVPFSKKKTFSFGKVPFSLGNLDPSQRKIQYFSNKFFSSIKFSYSIENLLGIGT
jgi:hypothetical protein